MKDGLHSWLPTLELGRLIVHTEAPHVPRPLHAAGAQEPQRRGWSKCPFF